MIEIDHTLLSLEALDNLVMDVITRQGTDYGEYEVDILVKKKQLLAQLQLGKAVVVYLSEEEYCTIVTREELAHLSTNIRVKEG
ncbi:MAG: hypothetical protein BGO90_04120 [Legionella sp. 40-6]|nr:YheU family protein [Legionella sp.]OJX88883.1 MAG: hypothetical protein BGO90_04120 [Legionella sp. 40-6]